MLKDMKKFIEEEYGYKVAYLGLYGSQNYNLDTPKSDIDLRAIVIPSLNDLVRGRKPVSKTLHINQGKVEQVDVKDIREYLKLLKKGNPAYLEPLFTDHYVVDDEFKGLFKYFKDNMQEYVTEVSVNMYKAIVGMALQKISRYEKKADPKDLLHTVRLWAMLMDYKEMNKSFKECLEFDLDSDVYGSYERPKYGIVVEQIRRGRQLDFIYDTFKEKFNEVKNDIFRAESVYEFELHTEFEQEMYITIERSIHDELEG
jgi:predicted nucleotidyltransferase